jgi:hypothetical protein
VPIVAQPAKNNKERVVAKLFVLIELLLSDPLPAFDKQKSQHTFTKRRKGGLVIDFTEGAHPISTKGTTEITERSDEAIFNYLP